MSSIGQQAAKTPERLEELSGQFDTSLPNRGFYDNDHRATLHQPHPFHGTRQDKSGWTFSICAYLKEADTIARCLLLNSHSKPYHWEATISFQDENQDENQTETHKRTWARVARRLKGLNLFWVREVDEQDHLHYHFIILGDHDEQELRDKLRASVHDARAKVHVDKIRTLASWCRYIVKAKERDRRVGRKKFGQVGEQASFILSPLWVVKTRDDWRILGCPVEGVAEEGGQRKTEMEGA